MKTEFKEGFLAYFRGDYAVALEKWTPLAERGAAEAQVKLGIMHAKGEGVEQDYGTAVRWYRAAAEQGSSKAQFNLGVIYENGQGVRADGAEAANW